MIFKKIIISRTDSIGDVMLTLPVAGFLKKLVPDCEIIFLGKTYTKDIVSSCKHIDHFIDWELIRRQANESRIKYFLNLHADVIIHVFPVKEIARLAKQAKIPVRIGSTGRIYHYFSCNRLVALSRRRSALHEAQLNLKLLKPFGANDEYSFNEIAENYGFDTDFPLKTELKQLIQYDKFNLVLHPKSKGSSREWGMGNFSNLINILPESQFKIFLTGTKEEGNLIKKELIDPYPTVIDLTGKLSLKELISFINEADGLVAGSTGPLHIASALGKNALGLYPPIKPMHPGRWAPIGIRADFLVLDKYCSKCRKNNTCECLMSISPEAVKNKLLTWLYGKN
jgi:heptosyltransferase III